MNKVVIYSEGNLTVMCNGEVYIKRDVDKVFVQIVEEAVTCEEVLSLMREGDATDIKIEKVTKEEEDKFIAQEYNKCVSEWKKNPKQYYIYEDINTNQYKLAKDILVNYSSFKDKGHRIIGNLFELYNNRLNKLIQNRVINLD